MICRWILRIFAVLYAVALVLFLIGTFGWFGQEQDPLAGVFLMPLGVPWNYLLGGAPEAALPRVGLFAPLVNLILLGVICRVVRR